MKRTIQQSVSDNKISLLFGTTKRRKIDDRNKFKLMCSGVHKMTLRETSKLDPYKYDKCPRCLTINNNESFHFIYDCTQCSYFVCNFCMPDIYHYNTNIIHDIHSLSRQKQSSLNNSSSDSDKQKQFNSRNTKKETSDINTKHPFDIGSQLLIPDNALDYYGNELRSHQLYTVEWTDKNYTNISTEYGEIDLSNIDYYIVDKNVKEYNIGQLVASRWPFGKKAWAQFYIGHLFKMEYVKDPKNLSISVKYHVKFADTDDIISKIVPVIARCYARTV
eukprot:269733_1